MISYIYMLMEWCSNTDEVYELEQWFSLVWPRDPHFSWSLSRDPNFYFYFFLFFDLIFYIYDEVKMNCAPYESDRIGEFVFLR